MAGSWRNFILDRILLMIRWLNITPLIRTFRSKMFGKSAKEKLLSFFNGSYHCRLVSSRSNTGYIEDETRLWMSVLALSLFSSSPMNLSEAIPSSDHITIDRRRTNWTLVMHDVNIKAMIKMGQGLGFKMFERVPKKSFFPHSMNHIMVE